MKSARKALPLINSTVFRGLGAVSQLVLVAWVTHHLVDKSEVGQFLFYLSCFTVISPMLLFGTQQYAMRHLSQYDLIDKDSSNDAARMLALSLRVLLWAFAFLFPLGWFLDSQSYIASRSMVPLRLILVNSVLGSGCLVVAAHLHGFRNLASSLFFSHICVPAVAVVLFAGLAVTDAAGVIWYHGIACFISVLLAMAFWYLKFGRHVNRSSLTVNDAQVEISACLDFWLLNTFILIANWAPLLLAGWIIQAEDIAELNVAQRSANLINFLLIVVSFAFAPKFRYAWSRNDVDGLRRMVSKCTRYLFLIGTLVSVAVVVASPWIMNAFGDQYRRGAMLLCIFAAGQYFNVITGTVNQVLTMCNQERTLRNICMVSALCSLVLGYILTTRMGAIGAALAVAISLTIQNVSALIAIRRKLGFWVFMDSSPRSLPTHLSAKPLD